MKAILLSVYGLAITAVPASEELCERTTFVRASPGGALATFRQLETTKQEEQRGIYGLSAVTVPPAGWKVHAVTIFTSPSSPEKWVKVQRARLNVVPKKGDLPGPDDDPRHGREVKVSVRESGKGVFAVVASDLDLRLEPGNYWLGLTPIYEFSTHGSAGHLLATEVRNTRFDDVVRSPDADGGTQPLLRQWKALGPRIFAVPGEHLAIKIEGVAIRRGTIVEWPAEEGPQAKQIHLRFATFDPLAGQPKVPEELAARPTGRLWIVQARGQVDQPFREALSRAGATPLRYVPDDAYVVALAPDAVETVRRLRVVRWVGPCHPAYRIDPGVFSDPIEVSLREVGMAGRRGTRAEVAAKWRERLGRWRRSQGSVSEFRRRERVSPQSFFQWRKRLAAEEWPVREPAGARGAAFIPVDVVSADIPRGPRPIPVEEDSGAWLEFSRGELTCRVFAAGSGRAAR
ncbi:MAG: hypothetical protein FJ247_13220 [Nitrospira sp.]|nr:hypothetical protein [Nitrospira sp.]